MTFQTQGLVIRETEAGEKYRQVTVLTAEYGLLRAFVRRRSGKRDNKSAGTDLMCYSRLDISKGRGDYIINDARPLRRFTWSPADVSAVYLAMYFCQLAELLVTDTGHTGECLRLLMNALYLLSQGSRSQPQLKATVELRLLSLCGYLPDLTGCAGCGAYEAPQMAFLPGEGCILCENCHRPGSRPAVPLTPDALHAMRHIVYADFARVFSFRLTGPSLQALSAASEAYTLSTLQEEPKALSFYKSCAL